MTYQEVLEKRDHLYTELDRMEGSLAEYKSAIPELEDQLRHGDKEAWGRICWAKNMISMFSMEVRICQEKIRKIQVVLEEVEVSEEIAQEVEDLIKKVSGLPEDDLVAQSLWGRLTEIYSGINLSEQQAEAL